VIGDAAGRIAWWLCRPSLGRALLCGAAAIYLGTFIGVDAVTMFCAAQGARLLLRALARRSVRLEAALPIQRRRDRSAVEPIEADADAKLVVARLHEEASHAPQPWSDPKPEITLDELIAGDPGPEPGDPEPEFQEPVDLATTAEANEDSSARIVPSVDVERLAVSANDAGIVGSDAAEALRIAVVEPR
jgi:hypothetical protein